MPTFDFPHKGRQNTAKWMYYLAEKYAGDIGNLAAMPLENYHTYLRAIPYADDIKAWGDPFREVVARPLYLLKWQRFPGLDCKKKAIMAGAWAERNRIPWRLVAMSETADKEIHHVFPILLIGKKWVNADATYPRNFLGAPKPEMTYAEILPRP